MRKLAPNRTSGVLLTVLAIIVAAVIIAGWPHSKPRPQPTALPNYCANGAVPSACIFGLQHSPYVIQSAYNYEANLLDGDIPVGDYDYMLPYGSERVRLPGGSWNLYSYEGAIYVPGSGWVARFIAPNGGHFALLHLQYVNGSGVRTGPLPNLPPPVFPEGHSGDDNTAQAAARLLAGSNVSISLSSTYRGQDVVGLSGYPTWPIYSNGGPGGPADGHLCLLIGRRALAFFWKVATGHDVRPTQPFPLKQWDHYRSEHHLRHISRFYGKHLRIEAAGWLNHVAALGGIVSRPTWHPRGLRGIDGYSETRFQRGTLTVWPNHPRWKPKVSPRKRLS